MHKDENYTGGGDTSDLIKWSEATTSVKKNLLQNNATSQTEHGVTFTVNGDGSVNVSGTASGGNGFVVLGTIELKQGVQYILSGGVSGNLRIDLRNADYSMWTNNTASQEVHSPKESFIDTFTPNNTEVVYVCARAQSGSTVSGTLYPMIRLASIADATYEPYIPDNTEVMRYTDNAVLGAKNRLPNNATSQTINGVTFTKNADGTITANGTATSNARLIVASATAMTNACADADVILSGCPSGGSENKYQIYTRTSAGYLHEYGDSIVIPQGTSFIEEISILVSSGQTVSNIVFKPMIRLATDTDDTYVPYAMTNRELTDITSTLSNDISSIDNVLGDMPKTIIRQAPTGKITFTIPLASLSNYAQLNARLFGSNSGTGIFSLVNVQLNSNKTGINHFHITNLADNTPTMTATITGTNVVITVSGLPSYITTCIDYFDNNKHQKDWSVVAS